MTNEHSNAVLLLSGGLDSAANLVLESPHAPFKIKKALTINYGQKAAQAEIRQSAKLAQYYKIEHVVLDFSGFSSLVLKKSSLLSNEAIPQPINLNDLNETKKTAQSVWVPNRNGVLISLAAAFAEAEGCSAVVVGFNAEEAVTFPDNTADFMSAMTESLKFSTANQVRVLSATTQMTKNEIVKALRTYKFPFDLLWSCYKNGDVPCKTCESCQRLGRALNQES